jgi:Undecaprenyl-phosphate glucose phosphotransferase
MALTRVGGVVFATFNPWDTHLEVFQNMLLRLKIYRFFLTAATYLMPFLAWEIGWQIWVFCMRVLDRSIAYPHRGHYTLVLFSSFVWAFMAERYKVTNIDELSRERTGARAATAASMATAVVLLGGLYFGRNDVFPRGLFVCCVASLLPLTVFLHAVFRVLYRKKLLLRRPTRLLIVGADQFARDAALRLQRLSFAPCEVVAYVRLPGQEVAVRDERVYDLDQINALHSGDGIDEAVMAIHPAQFSQIPTIIKAIEKLCVPARAIVDLGEGVVVREKLFQVGRMQMLDLTTTPADSLDYALLKRVFDVCFSALVLLVTLPIIVLVALAIRLTSPGPIFFGQERIGLNGQSFKMYKFRTMQMSAASESDTQWTTSADPRRTGVGAVLRKTSLDELPQFINVLKGDMSVVGPRPERPHFVNQFLQEVGKYNHRHCLRVGITGWAQVNGWRGDTSIQKRVEYDLYYLQNWTFGLDLRIICMTVLSALIGKNAY